MYVWTSLDTRHDSYLPRVILKDGEVGREGGVEALAAWIKEVEGARA